jgi:hypothetical protein
MLVEVLTFLMTESNNSLNSVFIIITFSALSVH